VSGERISPALERALRALAQAIAAAIWDQEIQLRARAQEPDLSSDGERNGVKPPKPS
jgi:hypothetical protein